MLGIESEVALSGASILFGLRVVLAVADYRRRGMVAAPTAAVYELRAAVDRLEERCLHRDGVLRLMSRPLRRHVLLCALIEKRHRGGSPRRREREPLAPPPR